MTLVKVEGQIGLKEVREKDMGSTIALSKQESESRGKYTTC
jgi:hypothetical protein